jgi:hypothetical protein
VAVRGTGGRRVSQRPVDRRFGLRSDQASYWLEVGLWSYENEEGLGNEKAYDSDRFIGSGTFRFCFKLAGERGFRPVRCRLCSLVCNKIRDEKLDGV